MIINPNKPLENGNYEVVHFVGYWIEPTDVDVDSLRNELRTDPEFELQEIVDELEFLPATEGCLKYYNDQVEADNVFDDNINQN